MLPSFSNILVPMIQAKNKQKGFDYHEVLADALNNWFNLLATSLASSPQNINGVATNGVVTTVISGPLAFFNNRPKKITKADIKSAMLVNDGILAFTNLFSIIEARLMQTFSCISIPTIIPVVPSPLNPSCHNNPYYSLMKASFSTMGGLFIANLKSMGQACNVKSVHELMSDMLLNGISSMNGTVVPISGLFGAMSYTGTMVISL